jgi:hypothetical protein
MTTQQEWYTGEAAATALRPCAKRWTNPASITMAQNASSASARSPFVMPSVPDAPTTSMMNRMTLRGLLPANPTRPSDLILVLTQNLSESLVNESIGDPDVIGDELHTVD